MANRFAQFDEAPRVNRFAKFSDAPAEPVTAAQAKAPLQGGWRDNDFVAGAYNAAASVPFAEKAAAGANALSALFTDETVKDKYNNTRDQQKLLNESFDKNHNTAANVGYIGGAVANPANWAMGGAGLLANAGLQAGSDTDFSKEGSASEFAGKAATNILLGKVLQKAAGMATGSNTLQAAGKYIGKKLSPEKLEEAGGVASKLANIGGEGSPLLFTAGKDAVDAALPIARSAKIAGKTGEAVENVNSLIGKQGKTTVDKVDRFGSVGKNVDSKYEAGKAVEIANRGFSRFLQGDTPGAFYVAQAAKSLKSAKPNSGEVIQQAIQNAKAVSIDEGKRVEKELIEKFGPIFKNADQDYKLLSDVRRQVKPFRQAAATGAQRAEEGQMNKELQNQVVRLLKAIPTSAGKTLGTLTGLTAAVRNVTGKASPKAQAKIIELLANKPTAEASNVVNRSRRSVADTLLQTNNRNALSGKNKVMDKFGGVTAEQYLPYLAMRLKGMKNEK